MYSFVYMLHENYSHQQWHKFEQVCFNLQIRKDTYHWPNRTKKKFKKKTKKNHASLQKSSRAPGVSGVTLQHWPGSSSELPASKAPVQSAEMHGLKHQSYKYTNQSGQRWTSKPRVLRVKITVWREHRETYSFSSSSVNRPYTAAVG